MVNTGAGHEEISSRALGAEPLWARLVKRPRRRGKTPHPNAVSDTGERIIWVDAHGEVHVERVKSDVS